MIYAILNETLTTVENIVESHRAFEENWIQVPTNAPVSIGDTYNYSMFYSPDGELRVSPEIKVAQDRIKELEQDNILKTTQIQELSDRNNFLEDCIAEMAGMVYA